MPWPSPPGARNTAPKNEIEELDCGFKQSSVARLNAPPDSRTVCEMCVQMDAQTHESAPATTMVQTHDTLTFQDSAISNIGDGSSPVAAMTRSDQTASHSLNEFFGRPVRIYTTTWLEADPIGTQKNFDPWNLYFTDPRVRYKLNNYAFIQCRLRLKILVNASPFYYGSMLVSYRPLPRLNQETISNDPGLRHFISYSQRPCAWLSPQRNEGAEMTLPFLNTQNWISAGSSQEMIDMGRVSLINYTDLNSANGVTGTGVTISVYAWAEDVHLSGPSLSLATQADEVVLDTQADEYGRGSVSQAASAVASTAQTMTRIPFLGRFATATQIGATAVSKIAGMFGFTNVPVIADTIPQRPEAFPKFASSEIGYPVEKLTLDPKNELTLDNTVCGAGADDELMITKLVQRESYLCKTIWTTAQASDHLLFSTSVTPGGMRDDNTETYPKMYFTPLAWVAAMFQNWRGDMIFRFRIVASKYHKGRLRVSFDPAGQGAQNLINTTDSSNVVFTEIVDLDAEAEVEFRVPYQQALPFLLNRSVFDPPSWDVSPLPAFIMNPAHANGTLTVRVLTALTAPIASSEVTVQVFVRGAENLEFANPTSPPKGLTQWAVQSDTMTTSATLSTLGKNSHVDDNQYLVNFGEKIVSLRQVLRRTSLVSVTTPPAGFAQDHVLVHKYFTKIPPFFGFDPNGIHTAYSLLTPPAPKKFNFVTAHPVCWILTAFIGFRGSMNWSFNVDSTSPIGHIRVSRLNQNSSPTSTVATDATTVVHISGTASENARFYSYNMDAGGAGTALTNQLTNAGVNVQCPMFTRHKFAGTSKNRATAPNAGDEEQLDMFSLELILNNNKGPKAVDTRIAAYCGIGTDFNVVYFLNVPTFIKTGIDIVPA